MTRLEAQLKRYTEAISTDCLEMLRGTDCAPQTKYTMEIQIRKKYLPVPFQPSNHIRCKFDAHLAKSGGMIMEVVPDYGPSTGDTGAGRI